ncbi:MAG: transcriptional regulator [Candidatus Aminicenantes bacterium]|nr:transcriptional regulator [Candidatus Aminicenantes bacterium]
MTPETFEALDPVVHSPVRLAVLSILVSAERAEFNFLKKATGATDGNLSTHLVKLEEAGYVAIKKSFQGRKPLTTCSLTEKGRAAFARYVKALESYLPPGK